MDEENDFAAMARYRKESREKKQVEFVNNPIFDELKTKFKVSWDTDATKFTIEGTEFGTLDFFPKANRLLIRRENRWKNSGLHWIVVFILKRPN